MKLGHFLIRNPLLVLTHAHYMAIGLADQQWLLCVYRMHLPSREGSMLLPCLLSDAISRQWVIDLWPGNACDKYTHRMDKFLCRQNTIITYCWARKPRGRTILQTALSLITELARRLLLQLLHCNGYHHHNSPGKFEWATRGTWLSPDVADHQVVDPAVEVIIAQRPVFLTAVQHPRKVADPVMAFSKGWLSWEFALCMHLCCSSSPRLPQLFHISSDLGTKVRNGAIFLKWLFGCVTISNIVN